MKSHFIKVYEQYLLRLQMSFKMIIIKNKRPKIALIKVSDDYSKFWHISQIMYIRGAFNKFPND